jgi:hypothetical protein
MWPGRCYVAQVALDQIIAGERLAPRVLDTRLGSGAAVVAGLRGGTGRNRPHARRAEPGAIAGDRLADALEDVEKVLIRRCGDRLSCPGRCLSPRSQLMLYRCWFGFAGACPFAGVARQGAGIGAGGVVRCRTAVSGGVAGPGGGVGDRSRSPVRGLTPERARVAAPVWRVGAGGIDGSAQASGLVSASTGLRCRGVGV